MSNDQLNRIEDKLDKIADRLTSIEKTQSGQAKDLEHHIARTGLAEDRLELIELDFKPIKDQMITVYAVAQFILKSIVIVGTIAGAVAGILKLYGL